MNSVIFGHGYVASILNVGLQRIKDGEIGLEGIPLGNSISKTVEAIKIVGAFDLDKKKIGKNLGEVTKDYWDGNIKFDDDYIIEEGYRDNRKGGNVDLEEELERLTDIYERKDAEIFVNTITTESFEPFAEEKEFLRRIKENDFKRISPVQFYFYSVMEYDRPSVFINCIPTMIANDPAMVKIAEERKKVIFGDDGATGATPLTTDILEHLRERRRKIMSICQFNIGGNNDFLSLIEPERNISKERTKAGVVKDILGYEVPTYIKPTGYLEPLGDNKFVSMLIPYVSFNEAIDEITVNMRVNDSPALAGNIVDLIRLGEICLERGEYGAIYPINAFYMKMPGPIEKAAIAKIKAFELLEEWLFEGDNISGGERKEI